MASQITTLPTPPTRQSPATFAVQADTFLGALPTFVTEANALATEAETNASTAEAQAALATGAAQDAMAYAATGNAVKWVSGTTYAIGDVVWSPSTYLTYRRRTTGAGTTDPATDTTNWAYAGGSVNIFRSGRTSNTILGQSDRGKLIDITGGTFSQTFMAAAILRDGWYCYIRNSGTGDITLDPDSSETIDGLASFVMYPGAVRLITSDGTNLRSIPIVGGTKTFTSTGSYVWSPGVQSWWADVTGGGAGGGGGARAASRYNGGGGGAGERYRKQVFASEVTAGASVTCTIGAKGTGGAAASVDTTAGDNGVAGGDSSVGTFVVAKGGTSTQLGGIANKATTSTHGHGGDGGGKSYPTTNVSSSGQGIGRGSIPGSTQYGYDTEWGGPGGKDGSLSSTAKLIALCGGQTGGLGGAAIDAGATGANGANPGDGGGGGGGNVNGSTAGPGGDGVDGKIVIVEVI